MIKGNGVILIERSKISLIFKRRKKILKCCPRVCTGFYLFFS